MAVLDLLWPPHAAAVAVLVVLVAVPVVAVAVAAVLVVAAMQATGALQELLLLLSSLPSVSQDRAHNQQLLLAPI
jgi:hypothetical protein